MSIKKSILYKKLVKKYVDYKLEYRIRAHERDIEFLKHKIEVHEKVLTMLNNRKSNKWVSIKSLYVRSIMYFKEFHVTGILSCGKRINTIKLNSYSKSIGSFLMKGSVWGVYENGKRKLIRKI